MMKRVTLTTATLLSSLTPAHFFAQQPATSSQLGRDVQAVQKSNRELQAAAVRRPAPAYPALARSARVSGTVEIEVLVDPHGDVIDARAISGHPLLKDSAVASARQWKFDTARLSQTATSINGTLIFVFDLDAEERANSLFDPKNSTDNWALNTRVCREEFGRGSPDVKKLGLALANLAIAAVDEGRVDESLGLFENAERQKILPAYVLLYYGKVLVEKHRYNLDRRFDRNQTPSNASLLQALQLFLNAYADESNAKPIDARKLIDIARWINHVYSAMDKTEEGVASLRIMLNSSALPESARAAISYELAVVLWKRAYYLVSDSAKKQPFSADEILRIREGINEGHFLIRAAQTLVPMFANSWFYEKQLEVIELSFETDPEKQRLLLLKAAETHNKFMALSKEHSVAPEGFRAADMRPYTSGMPSLTFAPTPPPPPPPPPAPPRSRAGAKPL